MKNITRRQIIAGAPALAAASALPLTPVFAQESADAYPSRDVKFICAFPAGSGADVYVRYFAERMRPVMKRTIVVENRAGANGNIATTYTARAKPDGYTVYVHAPSALAANMHLFKNPPVDVVKELQVAATINRQPFMLTVHTNSPVKTVAELVEVLRKKGDKASYGTTAPTGQVTGALMKEQMGLKALPIAYRTGPDSLNDLLSGNIDYAMYDPTFALQHSRPGRIRLLAVGSKERMQCMPDIPTMHEQGVKDVDVTGWWGMMGPAGIPAPIKKKLQDAFYDMARSQKTKEFLTPAGTDSFILSPEEAQKYFLQEIDAWARYVKIAKIEPLG